MSYSYVLHKASFWKKKSVVQFNSPVKQCYIKQKTKMNMPDNFYFRQPFPNCMITRSTVSEIRCADTNSLFISCHSTMKKHNMKIWITRMNTIGYALKKKSLVILNQQVYKLTDCFQSLDTSWCGQKIYSQYVEDTKHHCCWYQ